MTSKFAIQFATFRQNLLQKSKSLKHSKLGRFATRVANVNRSANRDLLQNLLLFGKFSHWAEAATVLAASAQ